jgi:hypothetical protein
MLPTSGSADEIDWPLCDHRCPKAIQRMIPGQNPATSRELPEDKGVSMEIGPVDILEVAFPGNEFNGAILPALENLIASGTIRVLDLMFAYKTEDGQVGSIELAGLSERYGPLFTSVDGDVPGGLLDAEDVAELTDILEPNSSIAVICWENTWAAPFVSALEGSGAVVLDQARVPRDVVLAALASVEG